MNEITFIIFGITGDLAKRKLFPALCKLIQDCKISNFLIIGVAREQLSSEKVLSNVHEFSKVEDICWQRMKQHFVYYALDVMQDEKYADFASFILACEQERKLFGSRLVHLALPSNLFCTVTENMGRNGIIARSNDQGMVGDNWQRIMYEKPFGTDVQSAQEINCCIEKYFNEHQIYRVDHYLTKELVSSILLVRFTNMFFEPLWNREYIDQIQIVLSETLTMEGRGIYFDHYGVLKDIVQNHMLQLLSLVAMELPEELNARSIQDCKSAVLKKTKCLGGILGQYEGYIAEYGVSQNSQTPTFAALEMRVDTQRWHGVPFFLKTGKALDKKNTSIHIKFKEVPCALRKRCIYTSNYLSIQIDPDPSFALQLNTKRPYVPYEVTPVILRFNHDYVFGTASLQAYEQLYKQIIAGDQSVSVRFDEIEYAWNVIDRIKDLTLPLFMYSQCTKGPEELHEINQRWHVLWRA